MRIQIKTRAHVWLFALGVTAFSICLSELAVGAIWLLLGPEAFSTVTVVYVAAVVPLVVALPTAYAMAIMGFRLSHAQRRLRRLADTDELTGLTNRRSFFFQAGDLLARAAEDDQPVALLVIDADHFKQLNDSYGHVTGDAALKFIAEKLAGCIRSSDLACRLGGEEFAILLPGVDETGAAPMAERLLEKIGAQPLVFEGRIIELTVSCGIADTSVSYEMTALFKAADDALYAAKDAGRNRAMLFTRTLTLTSPAASH